MKEIDDRELVRRYRLTRSPGILAELYRRHFDQVFRICYAQVHRVRMAEDAAELVFLRLARHPPRLSNLSLAGWLACAACRAAVWLDRQEKKKKQKERLAAGLHPEFVPEKHNFDDKNVMGFFARLSADEQTVVQLHVFEEQTLSVVGGVLGITAEAAQKRFDRAIDHLRLLMREADSNN